MTANAWSNPLRRREAVSAYLFLSPTLIGFVIFVVGPMVAAIVLSLFQWNLIRPPVFVGMENYQQLFGDLRLGPIYRTTFVIAGLVVIGNLVLGLIIALLLDQKMPALLRQFFRLGSVDI